MRKKYFDILFFTMCFFLIFNNIPSVIRIQFISGGLGNKLSFYPIFLGMLYTLYLIFKKQLDLPKFELFKGFILIYFLTLSVSLILGLVEYPFYEEILNCSVVQIDKLPQVYDFLVSRNIDISKTLLLQIWIAARTIKGAFLNTLFTFGTIYMIYIWYAGDFKRCFNVFIKAIISSTIIVVVYGSIETMYLAGNKIAENFLKNVNPIFYDILSDKLWYPPLLWTGQTRSIFCEPSFLGIWSGFAIPFLWYKAMNTTGWKKKIIFLLITILSFLVFMTHARTAIGLLLGEIFIIFVYTAFYMDRRQWKIFGAIICCTAIGFGGMYYFTNNLIVNKLVKVSSQEIRSNKKSYNMTPQKAKVKEVNKKIVVKEKPEMTIEEYFQYNIKSMTQVTSRSNGARLSSIYADLMIGVDNPLLGVGQGLVSGYKPKYLPAFAKNNREVNTWINNQNKYGIIKKGMLSYSAYSSLFAETGLLGVLIYFFPVIYIVIILAKNINRDLIPGIPLSILCSLMGMLASGISNVFNITYCYWILIGLGHVYAFDKPDMNTRESSL